MQQAIADQTMIFVGNFRVILSDSYLNILAGSDFFLLQILTFPKAFLLLCFSHLPYQNSKTFFTSNDKNNSIKTNLRTCNLQTIWSISYKSKNQFWLNLPQRNGKTLSTSNGKRNPHFQIDIFVIGCEKHSRRNAFWQLRLTKTSIMPNCQVANSFFLV